MNNKINDELNKQPGNPAVMEQALKLYTRNVNFNEAFDTLIENIRKIINLNKKLGISPDFPPSEQICKIMSEFKKASFDKKNIEQYLNDKVKETFNNPTDEDKTTYIKSMKNI